MAGDLKQKFLTEQEVAEFFSISVDSLRSWRKSGTGPAYYKVGGSIRYRLEDLEDFAVRVAPDSQETDLERKIAHTVGLVDSIRVGNSLQAFLAQYSFPEKRRQFQTLYDYVAHAHTSLVAVLYGLRRTGKSVLMLQCMQELPLDERRKCAYIKITRDLDDMVKLRRTLNLLQKNGINKVFIDEATLLEGFSSSAGSLSDLYSVSGMKIVMAGTDSLLFAFAGQHELFARMLTIPTTNVLFYEHARITGNGSIVDYIDKGGIFTDRYDTEYGAGVASFDSPLNAECYSQSAIAFNIQHSLECDHLENRFGSLATLYNAGHLTNFISRLVNDINNRFTVDILSKRFRNEQLGIIESGIRGSTSLKKLAGRVGDILDVLHDEDVMAKFMDEFAILNLDRVKYQQELPGYIAQIRDYLYDLSHLRNYKVWRHGRSGFTREDVSFIVQPGLRFRQCEAFTEGLLSSPAFDALGLDSKTVSTLRHMMLQTIRGRILEEVVIFEVMEHCPENHEIFQYRDVVTGAEYDLVVRNKDTDCCDLYEIKISEFAREGQARHLRNDDALSTFSSKFGQVNQRTVLYRGEDTEESEGVSYRNIESFLLQLPRAFPAVEEERVCTGL